MSAEHLEAVHAETIRVLEEGMWKRETRFDRSWLQLHAHPEFMEFGHSGRVYGYASLIDSANEPSDINIKLPLPNLKMHRIDVSTVLVTYDSYVKYGDWMQIGHRSSIWVYQDGGWMMRLHQGTPFDPDDSRQSQIGESEIETTTRIGGTNPLS